MRHLGRAIVALVTLTAGGCIKLDSFSCAQSSECQNGDLPGTCEPAGLCSFPDLMCPSGKKYGELAGGQSGQCVDEGGTSSSSGEATSPTTSVSATASTTFGTTFDPTTDATTDPGTDPTFDPTSATEVTATTTTQTTDPVTSEPMTSEPMTTGPSCGDVGQACINGTCCGQCAACIDGICMAGDPDMASGLCGANCSACTADGQCSVAPADTPCPADCQDIVWLPKIEGPKTTCYAYDPAPTMSVCDDAGQCKLPDPGSCITPGPEGGKQLISCDDVCLKDAGLCSQGNAASEVELESYCFLDTETPGCMTRCTVNMLAVDPAECNGEGICIHFGDQSCDPYFCEKDNNSCGGQCMVNSDCFSGLCEAGECQKL